MRIGHPRKLCSFVVAGMVFSFCCSSFVLAAVTATPKFLFLDGTRKSTAVIVSNNGDDDREVWVELKFGYVASDDSGSVVMVADSLEGQELSAATWIMVFPRRFFLGPGESQTVRLTTTPPPGLKDGEYWARVMITSKPRRTLTKAGQPKTIQNSGLVLQTQIGLPFHYRAGKVFTGVEVSNFNSSVQGSDLNVAFRLTRTGNASFWGTRTMRIIDQAGKVLFTSSKNQVVYKTFNVMEKFTHGLAPGSYKVEIELATGKRTDVRKDDLVAAPVFRSSIPMVIR